MSIKLIKIYLSRKAANFKMSQTVPNIQVHPGYPFSATKANE
ncbi:hypothetical protein M5D96_003170, partial [Drosophila gunungcola]